MAEIINPLLQWLNAHPYLAGLVVFLISTSESVAIIGTIIPGTVLMTAIGTLAGAGVILLWPTLLLAILGAIAGDGISYWIGYYFKDRLHEIWPFRKYPSVLETGEVFFHRHGGMSVFIGRFVGPVRALVPLVAGMLGMKPLRFFIANVTSAIGWGPVYLLPGVLLGAASLELPPDIAVHVIVIILLGAFCLFIALWAIQKICLLIHNQTDQSLNWIWSHLKKSPLFRPLTLLLKHHDLQKKHGQITLAFYFLLMTAGFIYLSSYIFLHGSENIFINNAAFHLFRSLRTPHGDVTMLIATLFGEKYVVLPLTVTLFAWLAFRKKWYTAWHVLALGGLTFILSRLIKYGVHSPRPWGIFQSPAGFSFPSGHTLLATVFYGGIILFIADCGRYKKTGLLYTATILFIAWISVSRLYLNAHWFTDVLGGWMFGSALLLLISISYHRRKVDEVKPTGIIVVTLLTLAVTFSVFYSIHFKQLQKNYTQLSWPVKTLSMNSWWQQTGDAFPLYRVNRLGMQSQLFTLQWLGSLSDIEKILRDQGWQVPEQHDWVSILQRIADVRSTERLPLVLPRYLDETPALILTKHLKKKLVILRLWHSHCIIQNQTLWVGFIEMAPRTYSWLFKRFQNATVLNPKIIFTTPPSQYQLKQDHAILLMKPKN